MTIQQLRYAIMVAEKGSISDAAKALFISQPSLSFSIRELEKEIGIRIFNRSRSGISITIEGMEFLGYARQVTQPMQQLIDYYVEHASKKTRFCVSSQHYTFSRNAFIKMVEQYGHDQYEFFLNETQTFQILLDVKNHFCDLGLLYLCSANKAMLTKYFNEMELEFTPLITTKPHIFVRHGHPLSDKKRIHFADLNAYPRVRYIQGAYEAPTFAEEPFASRAVGKDILVSDSAAVENFMLALDAYTICTGIHPAQFHREEIISLPLDEEEYMEVGYLIKKGRMLSGMGEIFVESIKEYA